MISYDSIKYILYGTSVIVGLAATIIGGLYYNQDKLLYMPNPPGIPTNPDENPEGWRSPVDFNQTFQMNFNFDYEEQYLETFDGVKIHTWLILHKDSTKVPTLIYFHGNAGNMGFRLKNAMYMFNYSKLNILMMDYRGYGKSTGIPSEKGLNIDADTVLTYAVNHPRLRGSPIVCFGRSLGGAVAISLAARNSTLVSGLVLENTFLSIPAMVDRLMPAVSSLKGFILRIKWDSDRLINNLKQPILFISGDSDELVPTNHMIQLHQLAEKSEKKDFFSVRGGTHNDTWEKAGRAYYEKLRSFLITSLHNSNTPQILSPTVENFNEQSPQQHIPTMNKHFHVD